MLKQLIDTHPASSYQNNLNYTENLHFESEKSSYSNVVQGSLGRITKKPSLVDESLKTVSLLFFYTLKCRTTINALQCENLI